MKLIIDIGDNLYTRLYDNGDIDAVDMLKACVAIRKGTPLPKGHGRLLDMKELINYIIRDNCDKGCGYIDERDLFGIPFVIEADREVSKDEADC